MVMGNKWGVSASFCLSIKREVDLNVSHQVQLSKSTFTCSQFKTFPSNITSECHSSGPKGTFQTDLTVLFLTPLDPNTANYWPQTGQEICCCSWSQSTAFLRVGEHLQGRSTCKVTWNCRPEAVHPNKNGEQIQQLFSGYLETRFEFMWDLICMA